MCLIIELSKCLNNSECYFLQKGNISKIRNKWLKCNRVNNYFVTFSPYSVTLSLQFDKSRCLQNQSRCQSGLDLPRSYCLMAKTWKVTICFLESQWCSKKCNRRWMRSWVSRSRWLPDGFMITWPGKRSWWAGWWF